MVVERVAHGLVMARSVVMGQAKMYDFYLHV